MARFDVTSFGATADGRETDTKVVHFSDSGAMQMERDCRD